MNVHELKTIAVYWDAVERGEKLFEVRRNDRFFQQGDIVRLIRVDEHGKVEYGATESDEEDVLAITATGELRRDWARRILTRRSGPVLQGGQFGIEAGFCVFSLLPVEPPPTSVVAEAMRRALQEPAA